MLSHNAVGSSFWLTAPPTPLIDFAPHLLKFFCFTLWGDYIPIHVGFF